MHFLICIVVGFLSILSATFAFNSYSLDPNLQPYNHYQPYNQYQSLLSLNPYSLYKNVPTPLSPRYFFSLKNGSFSFTFPRVQPCTSVFVPDVYGSCLNLATCILKGGKPAGHCNFGLKTCCFPFLGNSRLPVSTFTRNSFTQNPALFTINRASNHFCQVRLDFKNFDVGFTDTNGNCIDGLVITGQANTDVPETICGRNDDTHIYLTFDNGNPINLMITYQDIYWNTTNQWTIKATQIPCGDPNEAPPGCLQYYPESAGTVKSFNFRNIIDTITIQDSDIVTYHYPNLDYNVCIGSPGNAFGEITWTQGVGTNSYYFVMTEIAGLVPPQAAGTVRAAEFDSDCTGENFSNDYVEILDGRYIDSNGDSATSNLFCGVGFPTTVTSQSKPFVLHVVTNSDEGFLESTNGISVYEESVGFSLSYILS